MHIFHKLFKRKCKHKNMATITSYENGNVMRQRGVCNDCGKDDLPPPFYTSTGAILPSEKELAAYDWYNEGKDV